MTDAERRLELRVLRAAIEDHRGGCAPEACGGSSLDPCSLKNALDALAAHHGSITHLQADIDQEMGPHEERQQLAGQLREWAQDVLSEWMRLGYLTDVAGIEFQARARWQDSRGELILETTRYAEDLGRFRVTVNVEDLGLLPPIGPENDPALAHESWRDQPQWILRAWRDVVTGDRVRMPGTEVTAHVTQRLRHPSEDPTGEAWHMVPGSAGHWDDRLVQPGECCVSLDGGNPRFMKPDAPVEIEMTQAEIDAMKFLGHDWSQRKKLLTTE